MDNETLIGYHATTKEGSKEILTNGFEISKSKKDNLEWLGDGIYFWEDDYYAVQWNIIDMETNHTNKNKKNLEEYEIIKSIIKVRKTKLFEISSPEGSIIYREFKEKLKERFIQEGLEKKAEELTKRSDKFWTNLLEDNGFFDEFDVITAIFKNIKNIENYKDDIVLDAQKQICVKNKKCIKSAEIYKDQERISYLISTIFKRRKEIKK